MTRSLLALGSNINPREKYLRCARQALTVYGNIIRTAPLYQSEPYGVTEQESFYNTALVLDTDLTARQLLKAVKKVERLCGRKFRFRWGPREVDIDIILYGHQIVDLPQLQIPHVDFINRRFVLKPLCDLDAELVPPGENKTLAELLRMCPDPSKLIAVKEIWWKDAAQN